MLRLPPQIMRGLRGGLCALQRQSLCNRRTSFAIFKLPTVRAIHHSNPSSSIMKRIIVCCDGTWQDSDESSMVSPTNVTLISRAILQVSTGPTLPGIEQIVFYQPGVGTSYGHLQRVAAGAVGAGLMENVREAYGFIVHNWQPGDEIYLFGFSRGAYTARSVSGLISEFGLLTKRGMDGIQYVLDAYRENKLSDPATFQNLTSKYERSAANVPVKVVGVWDTVGSLGIPDIYIAGWKPPGITAILNAVDENYQFADTNLHPNVEFAFQALALNEGRAPFTPTIWKITPDNTTTHLKQCWFPGCHQSIGGGDPSHGLSDIALAWMVQQLADNTPLEFDVRYLKDSRKTFSPNQMSIPWGTEAYVDTYTGIYRLSGYVPRTPGKYPTPNGERTNETVHKSVLVRIQKLGSIYSHPDVSHLPVEPFGPLEESLSWP